MSISGGPMQDPHKEFIDDNISAAATIEPRCIAASAIIALEPGTTLRVYSGCFAERIKSAAKIVTIPPGFEMIFCGDLIHSGVRFDEVNHRLHCYLAVGDKEWEPDVVQEVKGPAYFCHYCGIGGEDSAKMRSHRHTCAKKQKARRARTNGASVSRTNILAIYTLN